MELNRSTTARTNAGSIWKDGEGDVWVRTGRATATTEKPKTIKSVNLTTLGGGGAVGLSDLTAPITWKIDATDTVGGSDEGANIGFDKSDDFYVKAPWTSSKMIFKARGTDKLAVNALETVTQPVKFEDAHPSSPSDGLVWRSNNDVMVRTGGQNLNLSHLHLGVRPNVVKYYDNHRTSFDETRIYDLGFGDSPGAIGIAEVRINSRRTSVLMIRNNYKWCYRIPTVAHDFSRNPRINPEEGAPTKRILLAHGSGAFDDDTDGTGDVRFVGGWSFGKFFTYWTGDDGSNNNTLAICDKDDDGVDHIFDKALTTIPGAGIGKVDAHGYTITSIPIITISSPTLSQLNDAFGDVTGAIGFNSADNRIYYTSNNAWWWI